MIDVSDIPREIEWLIDRDCNVVFVRQCFKAELRNLRAFGMDLTTSIVGYFDTKQVYRQAFNPRRDIGNGKTSLRVILRKLGCPYTNLHIAGNDANFALRALLLLTAEICRDDRNELQDQAVLARLLKIRGIGYPSISAVESWPFSSFAVKKSRRKKRSSEEPSEEPSEESSERSSEESSERSSKTHEHLKRMFEKKAQEKRNIMRNTDRGDLSYCQ